MVIIFGSNFFIAQDTIEERPVSTSPSNEKSEFQVSENSYVVSDELADVPEEFVNEGINFSTPLFDGRISKLGGHIFDVRLKKYSDKPQGGEPTKIMEKGEYISNTIIKAKDINIPKKINFNYNNSNFNLISGPGKLDLISKFGQVTIQKSFLFDSNSYGVEQQIIVTNKKI